MVALIAVVVIIYAVTAVDPAAGAICAAIFVGTILYRAIKDYQKKK